MSLPPKIVLHLGPHKTATTHLQRSLQAHEDELFRAKVQFLGPKRLRKRGRSIGALFGLADPFGPDWSLPPHGVFADGMDRLVLSDENFFGPLHDGAGKVVVPLYDGAAKRVADLVDRIGAGRLSVCLAVRNPVGFLRSGYTQMFMAGQVYSPEEFVANNPTAPVDWAALVESLAGISGIGLVTVWPFEDYADLQPEILEALVGQPFDLVKLENRRSNAGLSAKAIEVLLNAPDGENLKAMAVWARRKYPSGDEFPKPDLYSAQDVEAAGHAYDLQLDQISRMLGVKMLRAGKSA